MAHLQTFKGLTVFITGHTGFKGSWLALWLQRLGAKVVGFSLPPPTNPNIFETAALKSILTHIEGDVRDLSSLRHALFENQPDLIFHLAAQPIVLQSFSDPKATFETNALGTVNVLEAIRTCKSVKACVCITSDKCYDNQEWVWGYRENDLLGGSDPYSASKAMAELAVRSYRDSFFQDGPLIATARAGNVIGGGDFSEFRIVPDTMKALMQKRPIQVRNPTSVRPWLHVLEPLHGYLLLAERLLKGDKEAAGAYNFGPKETKGIEVKALVEKALALWGEGTWMDMSEPGQKKEMGLLRLNWDKAHADLNWQPQTNWEQALEKTVDWFKYFAKEQHDSKKLQAFCMKQIEEMTDEISTDTTDRLLSH